ncbi:MAG TPA: hypothetical protein VF229_02910, partial [Burkholderiaceae bacterium]
VATLGEGSLRAAVRVFRAPSRSAALAALELHSAETVAGAGSTEGPAAGSEAAAVRANTALLSLLTGGHAATPTWVLRDARGGFRLRAGMPGELAACLEGAPERGPPRLPE